MNLTTTTSPVDEAITNLTKFIKEQEESDREQEEG